MAQDDVGTRLRELRHRAGLLGKDIAAETGWQPSKVSRTEHGIYVPTGIEIRLWVGICGGSTDEADAITALSFREVNALRTGNVRFNRPGKTGTTMASLLLDYLGLVGVTQADLAKVSKTSTKHVSMGLNGKTAVTIELLDKWADKLGVEFVVSLRELDLNQ